jgi:hypothetical protein
MWWESYTWWWIYLLVFEWVGGLMVLKLPERPSTRNFSNTVIGMVYFALDIIISIFLAGVYTGKVLLK